MAQIDVSHLTFSYDGGYENIFEDVSFKIDTDWKLGFIGRNGRGKTTFLKLLMGELDYSGRISSPVAFEYFPYDTGDQSRNAIEVACGVNPDMEEWRLSRDFNMLELSDSVLYRPFNSLSHGEQIKVMLCALFSGRGSFLLIDEPTDHLDMRSRELVGRYLNAQRGFILVSHDRVLLDGCVDHVLSINRADIEVMKGNYTAWRKHRDSEDSFELAENERLKKEIKRLDAASRRTAKWSDKTESAKYGSGPVDRGFVGHKAAKLMKRSKTIEQRQEKARENKAGLLKNIETADRLVIRPALHHSHTLVEANNISIYYNGCAACQNVCFTVHAGEQVSLAGKNGCGKSSLLKLVAGEKLEHTGTLSLASNLSLSLVPQDVFFLSGGLRDYARSFGIDESLFKAILRKLDFSRSLFDMDMRGYSSGQKKKVLIARSLCEQAHLYIWDEPLNYVDVLSRVQIENLILEFKPAMLFVEHDRAFNDAVAHRVVKL